MNLKFHCDMRSRETFSELWVEMIIVSVDLSVRL
jgi:hypothetical protein